MFKSLILCLALLVLSCNSPQTDIDQTRKSLVDFALKHLDSPYDYKNKKGFDCSGFVQSCYKHIGKNVPRSSKTQSKYGKEVKLKDAELGDILVFTGSNKKLKTPGHTAMVTRVENDTIFFIHSTLSIGVMINNLNQDYYKNRYLTIRSYF